MNPIRFDDWTSPVPPVRREVVSVLPDAGDQPPILFVPGLGHGAWAFAEHWLDRAASRGFGAHAVSPRERGDLRSYAHDVVQVAAALPRRAVLVGHGCGAMIVTRALARYPARAVVLAAPVVHGWATLGAALRANPVGTLPALVGGRLGLNRRQLFSPALPAERAEAYLSRLVHPGVRARWQFLTHGGAHPAGGPPTLVIGSPDDRVVPRSSLDRTAARFGAAPLLFPGMGHDLMLDPGWAEPIDAVLDWLTKELAA